MNPENLVEWFRGPDAAAWQRKRGIAVVAAKTWRIPWRMPMLRACRRRGAGVVAGPAAPANPGTPMTPFVRTLLLLAATLPPVAALAQGATPPASPATTGEPSCDAAAIAWRNCIAASPKNDADKAQANLEVDKFMRDVADAGPAHRPSITGACPRTREGYETMLRMGTCAANTTGARDDVRVARDPVPPPIQRR